MTGCEAWVVRRGEMRRCAQTTALITWTDHTGCRRSGCSRHAGGLKRRYPAELPERTGPRGTLWLGTPWTRGAFAPADVIEIENAIPKGYAINVIAKSRTRFVLAGMELAHGRWGSTEIFRTTPTDQPYRAALAVCERLALGHFEELVDAG
jgi:hypothetical protein